MIKTDEYGEPIPYVYGKTLDDCKAKFANNIIWSTEPVRRSQLDQEKLFYERFFNLLNDRELMRVFEHFGPQVFRRSSVLEGFEQFIREQNFSGQCVLEIGSLKGLTAIVLARHFSQVVSIDIVDDPQKYEIAKLLGVTNIKFLNVADNLEKAKACAAMEFDAAFVDGDHHADTFSDFALVKGCGRVLMHEFWNAQPAVMALVDRLRTQGNVVTKNKWALWIY